MWHFKKEKDFQCPYEPCGSNADSCVGCRYDPKKRPISRKHFYDCNTFIGCGDCIYCNPKADLDGVESTCKRIDHKKIQFAIPWFKSYDCGQLSGITCSDFKPKKCRRWLYNHWKKKFLREAKPNALIGLCLNRNQSVRYYVRALDFFNNTFRNEDGSLKWVKKIYYKRSKDTPIGYKLITEYPQEKDNEDTSKEEVEIKAYTATV